jgi:hypothetical protein
MVSGVTPKTVSNARQVKVVAPGLAQGQVGAVEIVLEAQGDENALAFSLAFDPAKLVFAGATASDAAGRSVLNINANAAAQGRLGFVLALKANQSFVPGSKQLISVSFRAAASVSGAAAISFSDLPVPRGISDPNSGALAADYIDAVVVVTARPSLKVAQSASNLSLSWPVSATGFVLQESSDRALAATSWTVVPITPSVANNQNVVAAPLSVTNRFYRLYHP